MVMETCTDDNVQVPGHNAGILEKLCFMGSLLQNSTLLKEAKILDKLLYKYKNQHGREKYFKSLQMIRKSLVKWRMLSLDEQLIAAAKTTCATNVSSLDGLKDLLIALKHGGKLVIRNIVLCQEAVQYSLGFLSLEFFVTLHVTLFALLSRIWILFKDYWSTLVESYQLIRLVFQSQGNHDILSQYPECLTLLLKDDLKDVYDITRNEDMKNYHSSLNTSSILEKLFGPATGDGATNSASGSDSVVCNDLDLGEPVKDIPRIHRPEDFNPTPKSSRQAVSGPKTSLALRFDLELDDHDSVRADAERALPKTDKISKKSVVETSSSRATTEAQCDVTARRKVHRRLVTTGRRCSLRRVADFVLVERQTSRYTLRTLAAVDSYRSLNSRKLRGLLAIVKHSLYSEPAPDGRKVLLRARSMLKEESTSRELKNNVRVKAKIVPPKSGRRRNKDLEILSRHAGEPSNSVTTDIEPKTTNKLFDEWVKTSKGNRDFGQTSRLNEHRSPKISTSCEQENQDSKFCNQIEHLSKTRHVTQFLNGKKSSNDKRTCNNSPCTSLERDEIDDIFSSLGL